MIKRHLRNILVIFLHYWFDLVFSFTWLSKSLQEKFYHLKQSHILFRLRWVLTLSQQIKDISYSDKVSIWSAILIFQRNVLVNMEEGEEITGPWRATRLWNNIIRSIRIFDSVRPDINSGFMLVQARGIYIFKNI